MFDVIIMRKVARLATIRTGHSVMIILIKRNNMGNTWGSFLQAPAPINLMSLKNCLAMILINKALLCQQFFKD